jgi:hypothetical protein
MKRFIAQLIATLALVLGASGMAYASPSNPNWSLKVYAPQSPSTSSTVNVEYKVLSVDPHDFAVSLYEDELPTAVATNHTQVEGDPNTAYGNSGSFSVSLPNGHHSFHVVAVNQSDNADSDSANTSVDVDATGPSAPAYGGKTQSGNSYNITFTAPNDADVASVKIFASTSKTYTANSSTQVGVVSVSPNQTVHFSYNAPDSATRYFSVQAYDAFGNGSSLVGDPGTVVTPVRVVGGHGGTSATTTSAGNGQVQGATTNSGETNASGQSSTTKKNGKTLGAHTSTKKSSSSHTLANLLEGAVLVLLILGGLYYWFVVQKGNSWFKKKTD